MKKVLISGSWRCQDPAIEQQVRQQVRDLLAKKTLIIVGGALGVDFWTTDEVMRINPTLTQLCVILPSTLHQYSLHYRKRAREGVISIEQAESLINQLQLVKRANPQALIETIGVERIDQAAYYQRNTKEVELAEELIAFQVGQSAGTQDTIEKARRKGISVQVYQFAL